MSGIQVLLITSIIFTAIYFLVRLRNRIFDVLLLLALMGAAVLLVLFPDWTSILAHRLGVGRGADLVFYTCIVLFWFVLLKFYTKLRQLEQQITHLTRKDALEQPASDNETATV
jgi:small membrane protein